MTLRPIEKLVFVYNADSGILSSVIDSARKLLSINGCPLCSLTHSLAGEKVEWKTCKESIGVPVEYLHRDELTAKTRAVIADRLPCVLAEAAGETIVLLDSEVIGRCKGSVADFRGRLTTHAAMRGLDLPLDLHPDQPLQRERRLDRRRA